MKGLTCAAVLAVLSISVAACGSGRVASRPPSQYGASNSQGSAVSAKTISSSGLFDDGRLRCTAVVAKSVEAGSPLDVTLTVRNISDRTVAVLLRGEGLWLVVRAADGTTYDTRVPLRNEIGGIELPTPLAPGTTQTVDEGKFLPVRWRGPLRVTPGCGNTALPAVTVAVNAPGPPDDLAAVADVVAASGHLLDRCRPRLAGVPVQGLIYPPSGKAPPMAATCSVSITGEGRFSVADALIVSPPGVGYAHVSQPYEDLSIDHPSPFEVIAWEFVLTRNGATSVAAAEADATRPANRMAPDWRWTGSDWLGPGGGRCGGSGGSGGGSGPDVVFVSVCPS